jgi:hypothetical protein
MHRSWVFWMVESPACFAPPTISDCCTRSSSLFYRSTVTTGSNGSKR